jgi:hypothetical protein
MKLSNIEKLKLLSLPLSILFLSYLGFLAIKFQVAVDFDPQTNNPSISERAPGSVNTAASLMKQKTLAIDSRDFKKPHGPIEVEVNGAENRSIMNNDRGELIGLIKFDRDLDLVNVQWHLPAGVELVGGVAQESFREVKAGDQKEVRIQILSHLDSNQQVHLEASFRQGDDKIGHTAQFNTVEQQKLNTAAGQKASVHAQSLSDSDVKIWQ